MTAERDLPPTVVVDENGNYWRAFDGFYSMCPVSTDNDPVRVAAIYVRLAARPAPEPLNGEHPMTKPADLTAVILDAYNSASAPTALGLAEHIAKAVVSTLDAERASHAALREAAEKAAKLFPCIRMYWGAKRPCPEYDDGRELCAVCLCRAALGESRPDEDDGCPCHQLSLPQGAHCILCVGESQP